MNLLLLKQLSILGAFAGAILGFVTSLPYVPYIDLFAFLIAFTCLSAFVLVYMKRNDLVGILSVKEGCIFGAVIGFVSFVAFSIIFAPISMLLGWILPTYTKGFFRFAITGGFGSFIIMIFLLIFMAGLSALFNGFAGLVTAYVYELITGIKKDANQNNSIDFEIKG